MQLVSKSILTTFLVLSTFLALGLNPLFAQSLANDKLVFLQKIGNDSAGNPLYRVVDSSQTQMRQLYERFYNDKGVQKVIEAQQRLESENLAKSTPVGYQNLQKPNPVYLEVGSGTGTYNDWKGTFSIQDSSGRVQTYDQPRVVVDLNDSMFRSSDQTLVEQTIVHEVGHGIMRIAYGKSALPDTPWLGRPHYGDLVTDDQLGLIEGWAEFVGAYFTGRNTIAEDPPESLTMNAYAYKDDGSPKSPQQLMATEGWVATVMLHIANHPSISKGYEKLVRAMQSSKGQGFNEILREFMAKNPEDSKFVSEVLTKDSINQISQPLGGEIVTKPGDPLPPKVDTPDQGQGAEDRDLLNMFNDYQSSLNTYAQLRLDSVHVDWYRGAWPQEIQRRMNFQSSLVQSLQDRLVGALREKSESSNQALIAQALLDNMEKIRFEHNRALQSYQKTNFWNQGVRSKLQAELKLYKDLYQNNKVLADSVHTDTMYQVWEQRSNRLAYRIQQRENAAAPVSSNEQCIVAYDKDCKDAYNKLLGAMKANDTASSKEFFEKFRKASGQ